MRAALLVVVFGACGRIGFDTSTPDREGIAIDAFETTSTTFVPIPDATLTIPPSSQRWLLLATATLQSTSLDEIAAELRYTVDGVERGIGGTQNTALDRPGPFQHFAVIEPSATAQVVAFELRDASAGTARVEQLRAHAIPLGDGAHHEAADAIQDITAQAYAPAVTFTPALAPGEYLFLALANTSDAPGESDCYTRWIGPAGTGVAAAMQMPRGAWQSQLLIWRETVGASPTITLEAHVSSDVSRIRYVRLVAIPTAELALAFTARNTLVSTTTEALVHELAPAIEAERYLWLATARVEANCNNVPDPSPDRQIVFDGSGVTPSTVAHVNDNCSYETTFGVVEVLASRPARLATTVRSGNGRIVEVTDSAIVLLGL